MPEILKLAVNVESMHSPGLGRSEKVRCSAQLQQCPPWQLIIGSFRGCADGVKDSLTDRISDLQRLSGVRVRPFGTVSMSISI